VQLPGHRGPRLMVPQDKRFKQRGGAVKSTGVSQGSVGPNPHFTERTPYPTPRRPSRGLGVGLIPKFALSRAP
jgi:hypothetical protein